MSRNGFLFAVMCLVWGLSFLPAKIGTMHAPPVLLAATRFLIAGALMLLWAGRDLPKVPRAAWPRLLATALLLNTANYAFLFWGVAHAPSGLSAIVNFATVPIFTLLASRVLEGNPITTRKLAAIALGTVGLGFLFATRATGALGAAAGDPREILGLAAIALGTLFYCVGAVLARPIAGTMPTLTLAGWQTLIGGVGLIVIAAALGEAGPDQLATLLIWPVWPVTVFLVIAGSLMGFTIYMRLLRDWGAFHAGLYAFISPAIAVLAGMVVLGEPFGWAEGLGALLMFGAAAIALRR